MIDEHFFKIIFQELNKCKTELQYWRSKSPAIPICTSCGQKLAPSLPPPEDFQALVNQGVKPEDIILNLRDDTDIESDGNMHESNSGALTAIPTSSSKTSSVFAFPDKDTTAKLLAVNSTVTKNQLKRQHFSASSMSSILPTACNDGQSAFNIYANGSSNSGNSANCCECQLNTANDNHAAGIYTNATSSNENFKEFSNATDADDCRMNASAQLLPSEMTNRMNCVRGSNIIRTTATAASNSNNWYGLQQEGQQSNPSTTMSKSIGGDVASADLTGELATSVSLAGNENVRSIKLPQAVGGRSHRSVIVSPTMLLATKGGGCNGASRMGIQLAAKRDSNINVENSSVATPLLSGAIHGGDGGEELSVGHVVSLQAITSHDTKKARRVQKATRCLNGSGKRSK